MTCRCTYKAYPTADAADSKLADRQGSEHSSELGACRCSQLCHKVKGVRGCTSTPPQNSDSVREKDDRKHSVDNKRRLSNDSKENGKRRTNSKDNMSSSLAAQCRCSRSHRTRSRQRSSSEESQPNDRRRSSGDIKRNGSSSTGSCGCYKRRSSSKSSSFIDMEEKRSGSIDSCRCYVRAPTQKYGPRTHQLYNVTNQPFCQCGVLTNEVPVKESKADYESNSNGSCECSSNSNATPSDKMNAFSLDSMDIKYLEQVRLLNQQDCKLKQELDNLTAQETAIKSTIKGTDGSSDAPPGSAGGKPNSARMLRALNKELRSLSDTLKDRIEDLRLERDQLAQKIDGPMARELERWRKKYIEAQAELSARNQPDFVDTTAIELQQVRGQLARTQENIGDMALVNDGIKQEVMVLEFKCSQMEQALIKQKMQEIDTINKLNEGELCSCSSEGTSDQSLTDTSCSCNDNPCP